MFNPSRWAAARARMNSRMTETIRAGSYTTVLDETTGANVETWSPTVYSGIARVKYESIQAQGSVSAGQFLVLQGVTISVPRQQPTLTPGGFAPSPAVLPELTVILPEGTVVEVLTSLSDPALVGRRYTITGAASMGQTTANRYPAEERS